jgi:hypothetical protein
MTLEELTALEDEWQRRLPVAAVGDPMDSDQQIEILQAWRRIFGYYVIEAREGEVEFLKRALFLYWYSLSEPSELNGLYMLEDVLVIEMLERVNDIAKRGELDTEFMWMLPWYYSIADYYLDRFEGNHELKEVSKANMDVYMPKDIQPGSIESYRDLKEALARKVSLDPWEEMCLKSSFSNRGQMGYYWKSIQNNVVKELERVTESGKTTKGQKLKGFLSKIKRSLLIQMSL